MKKVNNYSDKYRILSALLTSLFAAAINYFISLFLTSYITENVSAEAYGFVSLAKNFSGYTVVLTSCLNAYAARYITVSYIDGDIRKSNTYFSTVYFANIVLSLILLFASGVFIIFLDRIINIPNSLVVEVKVLFLLDFFNYMILAIGSVFSSYSYIKNRIDILNTIKLLTYIVEALTLVVLFNIFSPSIIIIGLSLVVSSLFSVLLNRYFSKKTVPELKIKMSYFTLSATKEIVLSGIWNSFNQLGNYLNIGLDLLVTNILLTAHLMGQLSIVKTLSTIFSSLFQMAATPFQPLLLKHYAKGNKKDLVNSFGMAIKMVSCFSNILFAGLIAFGRVYFHLWVPSQNSEALYLIMLVTIMGTIIDGAVYPLFYTYTLTLKNKIPCIMTILSGLINVVGMYVLITYFDMGVYAVVLTTSVLSWLMHFIFTPLYCSHCLELPWYTFYPILGRVILSAMVNTGVFYSISKFYYPNSWIGLCVVALICGIIGIVVHVFVTAKSIQEVKSIARIIRRKENDNN